MRWCGLHMGPACTRRPLFTHSPSPQPGLEMNSVGRADEGAPVQGVLQRHQLAMYHVQAPACPCCPVGSPVGSASSGRGHMSTTAVKVLCPSTCAHITSPGNRTHHPRSTHHMARARVCYKDKASTARARARVCNIHTVYKPAGPRMHRPVATHQQVMGDSLCSHVLHYPRVQTFESGVFLR